MKVPQVSNQPTFQGYLVNGIIYNKPLDIEVAKASKKLVSRVKSKTYDLVYANIPDPNTLEIRVQRNHRYNYFSNKDKSVSLKYDNAHNLSEADIVEHSLGAISEYEILNKCNSLSSRIVSFFDKLLS